MKQLDGYIDLHIHSKYSDGHFGIKDLIEKAADNNTCFVAISDHDSIKSLKELQNELLENMYSTSSVEFSTYLLINQKKIKLHLLGYGFDPNNIELNQLLNELKNRRLYFHNKFINQLQMQFNNLPFDEIKKMDIEKYCWFDRELLACISSSTSDSNMLKKYYEYFKSHKLRYGMEYPIDIEKAINVINKSGGISVLAHPMAYGLPYEDIQNIIKKLVFMGLQGIEVYQSDCCQSDSIRLLNEVNKYNLLYSVGSDFHRIINSDGRKIGRGIDDNLCISSTSVTDYLLEKKLVFKRRKK